MNGDSDREPVEDRAHPRGRAPRPVSAGRTVVVIAVVCVAGGGAALAVRTAQGPSAARAVAVDSSLTEQCDAVPASAVRTTFTSTDGDRLGAALVGQGNPGPAVVLRHGASQTICDWLPWADELQRRTDAEVALYDRRGSGSSGHLASAGGGDAQDAADLVAVAEALAARVGTERPRQLVTASSSRGTRSTHAALDDLTRVDGVEHCAWVAVSPVLSSTADLPTAHGERTPVLTLAWETERADVAATVPVLAAAAALSRWTVAETSVDTDDHSLALVRDHPVAAQAVVAAVRGCDG